MNNNPVMYHVSDVCFYNNNNSVDVALVEF